MPNIVGIAAIEGYRLLLQKKVFVGERVPWVLAGVRGWQVAFLKF
jgi:hypothetical protein